jgi:hypothetical protein
VGGPYGLCILKTWVGNGDGSDPDAYGKWYISDDAVLTPNKKLAARYTKGVAEREAKIVNMQWDLPRGEIFVARRLDAGEVHVEEDLPIIYDIIKQKLKAGHQILASKNEANIGHWLKDITYDGDRGEIELVMRAKAEWYHPAELAGWKLVKDDDGTDHLYCPINPSARLEA